MAYRSKLDNYISEVNEIRSINLMYVNHLFKGFYSTPELILLQRVLSSIPFYYVDSLENMYDSLVSFYDVSLTYSHENKSIGIDNLMYEQKFQYYEVPLLLISSIILDGYMILEFEGEDAYKWSVEIISNEISIYYDDYKDTVIKLI